MKYVSEKANCSAWIILKAEKIVGKVQAHFSSSVVTVDVWDFSKDESFQQNKSSGYGYDKLTAAIAGCTIDNIILSNHCGTNKKTEKLLKSYITAVKLKDFTKKNEDLFRKKAKRIGASFDNWSTFYNGIESYNFEGDKDKAIKTSHYTSLFLESGLKKLKWLGYTVIQAI